MTAYLDESQPMGEVEGTWSGVPAGGRGIRRDAVVALAQGESGCGCDFSLDELMLDGCHSQSRCGIFCDVE